MIRKLARYKVKEEWLPNANGVIKAFVAAIAAEEPDTIYTAYQEGDGTWFTHIMAFTDETSERQHQQAAYTTRFVEALYPNCEVQPAFTDLTMIATSQSEAETA